MNLFGNLPKTAFCATPILIICKIMESPADVIYFHSRKMGVSCFSEKKQVPTSTWYRFLSVFLYYYVCILSVFLFVGCCQQCVAFLIETIHL